MQIRPTAFTIGLIIHFSIALFSVYTEFGIDSEELMRDVFVVDYPQFNGAIGAALIASERG